MIIPPNRSRVTVKTMIQGRLVLVSQGAQSALRNLGQSMARQAPVVLASSVPFVMRPLRVTQFGIDGPGRAAGDPPRSLGRMLGTNRRG